MREHIQNSPFASSSPDLLKIDIDHADCLFMEEALRVLRPKVIHFEIWPLVPPPLVYVQQYQPDIREVGALKRPKPELVGGAGAGAGLGGEPPGCSLAAFLARAPGYDLVAVAPEDALVVRSDLRPLLRPPRPAVEPTSAWVRGALCHPGHLRQPGTFAFGFDFRSLSDPALGPEGRLARLRSLLEELGVGGYELGLAP